MWPWGRPPLGPVRQPTTRKATPVPGPLTLLVLFHPSLHARGRLSDRLGVKQHPHAACPFLPCWVPPQQDVAEDQLLLARLVHNLRSDSGNSDEQFEMLEAAQVGSGDA